MTKRTPEALWNATDTSKPPGVGMLVHAFFGSDTADTARVTEWQGNRCWFDNERSLRWSSTLGFLYGGF